MAGLEGAVAGVLSGGAELLLDLEQAVVWQLASPRAGAPVVIWRVFLATARSEMVVSGPCRSGGNHGGVAVGGGQLDSVEGFSDGTDLVQRPDSRELAA